MSRSTWAAGATPPPGVATTTSQRRRNSWQPLRRKIAQHPRAAPRRRPAGADEDIEPRATHTDRPGRRHDLVRLGFRLSADPAERPVRGVQGELVEVSASSKTNRSMTTEEFPPTANFVPSRKVNSPSPLCEVVIRSSRETGDLMASGPAPASHRRPDKGCLPHLLLCERRRCRQENGRRCKRALVCKSAHATLDLTAEVRLGADKEAPVLDRGPYLPVQSRSRPGTHR